MIIRKELIMAAKKKVLICVLFILIASLLIPIIVGCAYGLPSADDFSNTLGFRDYDGNHLFYPFIYLHNIYIIWQGTYTGLIFCGIPVYYLFNLNGLRLCMVLVTILFFILFLTLILTFIKSIGVQHDNILIVFSCLSFVSLLYLLGSTNYDEIFYWYTGIAVYTIPICNLIMCLVFYLLYGASHKKLHLALAIVLAFIAAGGSLNIAALLCSLLLLGLLYDFIVNKTISNRVWIGLSGLVGAIINTIAPGNFSRHTAFDEKIRPITALNNTLCRVFQVLSFDLFAGFLLILITTSLICGIIYLGNSSITFKLPGLVTLYGLFGVLITDFPVILGYAGIRMPTRVTFVEYLAITIYTVIIATYWGGWLANTKNVKYNISFIILVAFCLIPVSNYIRLNGIMNITPYKMIKHITIGDFQTVVDSELSIINQLETSNEPNVTVYVDSEPDDLWANVMRLELSEDSTYWVNYAISQYYNKDSITLRYIY